MSIIRSNAPRSSGATPAGSPGKRLEKKKFTYQPSTAHEIRRAVGATKKHLAIARELIASVRASRSKTG
jgi:hypothetical protein